MLPPCAQARGHTVFVSVICYLVVYPAHFNPPRCRETKSYSRHLNVHGSCCLAVDYSYRTHQPWAQAWGHTVFVSVACYLMEYPAPFLPLPAAKTPSETPDILMSSHTAVLHWITLSQYYSLRHKHGGTPFLSRSFVI
jgi:hypothetical protein